MELKYEDFAKGMGIGLAVGAAITYMAVPKRRTPSTMMRRVVRAAEGVVDMVANVLGM